ncbi:MAG TPA: hypothetical protein DER67_07760 [Novosphingobium sp.]|nr:hypothetical protein [Novosphingobium sp.]
MGLTFAGGDLKLRAVLHLTKDHPGYSDPRKSEWACYRDGWLTFAKCRDLIWNQKSDSLPQDVDGYDMGTINTLTVVDNRYVVETDVLKLRFQADGLTVTFDQEQE